MKKLLIRLQIIFFKLRIWSVEHPRKVFAAFLVVALVFAIGGGIIYTVTKKSPLPPVQAATQELTDKAGVYSIKLYGDWVQQTDVAAEVESAELVALAPKTRIDTYKEQTGNALLHTTIALYYTTDAPKVWFEKQQYGTPVVSQELPLPGKDTFAAKIMTDTYSEDHYVVSHNGALLHLTFHRITKSANPERTDDFTTDLGDFDKIFTSLTFLK
jgi:hypothetical protein